jgi:hypothetical protein
MAALKLLSERAQRIGVQRAQAVQGPAWRWLWAASIFHRDSWRAMMKPTMKYERGR